MKDLTLKTAVLLLFLNSSVWAANIPNSALDRMADVNTAELNEGVPPESLTKFYIHKRKGKFKKTRAVVVIFPGLLNSPIYTKWMADKIHSFGLNVVNVNLTKHNHNKQSDREKKLNLMDLDTITAKDFQRQVELVSDLAEHMGDKIVFVGHSAGALSAVGGMMNKPNKTIGLVLYSPSFKLNAKSFLSSFLIPGKTPFVRKLINSSGDKRYLSTQSGRATHNYAQTFKQKGFGALSPAPAVQFKPMIKVMKALPNKVFWIDTLDDATISEDFNLKLVKGASNIQHYIIPKNAAVAHVATASKASDMETKSGRAHIKEITRELYKYIKEVSN